MSYIPNTFYAFLAQKLESGGSETTVYVDRLTTRTGETIATTDFAAFGHGFITVNPDGDGVSSYPEYISFTAVDSANEAFTGAVRGLSAKSNTVVTGNKRFHPVGTPVVISFGAHNVQDMVEYVDNAVSAASFGTNLVVSSAIAGETINRGNYIYFAPASQRWFKVDADDPATINGTVKGFANSTQLTTGNSIASGVTIAGIGNNQALDTLTPGTVYYASGTAGRLSSSAGATEHAVGIALTSSTLLMFAGIPDMPSAAEKDAMAGGSGFGTPSSTNKFLTQDSIDDSTIIPNPVVRTYVSSGSPHTWTKPAGLKYVIVEAQGAGAHGTNASGSSLGGGAGGYGKKLIAAGSLGTTETVTVGAANVGSGNTSFGAHVTAGNAVGQTGGSASGGDINITGQNGGGGAEGGSDSINIAGVGASSMFGKGGNRGITSSASAAGNGGNATGYGAGGGGAASAVDSSPDGTAGNGTEGIVIVTEYYN